MEDKLKIVVGGLVNRKTGEVIASAGQKDWDIMGLTFVTPDDWELETVMMVVHGMIGAGQIQIEGGKLIPVGEPEVGKMKALDIILSEDGVSGATISDEDTAKEIAGNADLRAALGIDGMKN